jgi:hypothetical protein
MSMKDIESDTQAKNIRYLTTDQLKSLLHEMNIEFDASRGYPKSYYMNIYSKALINGDQKRGVILEPGSFDKKQREKNDTFISTKRERKEDCAYTEESKNNSNLKSFKHSNISTPTTNKDFSSSYYKEASNAPNPFSRRNTLNAEDIETKENPSFHSKKSLDNYSKISQKQNDNVSTSNFKAPRSNTSLNIVKTEPEKVHSKSSSSSLRRIQIKDSIIKAKVLNTQENKTILNKMDSIDLKKLTRNLVIFSSFAAVTGACGVFYFSFLKEANFANFNSRYFIILIFAIGLSIMIVHFKKQHNEFIERENRLIAENCLQAVKDNLLNKKQNGVEDPQIDIEHFIQEYAVTNSTSSQVFKESILPFIRDQTATNDTIEEVTAYNEGDLKTFWKLKI